ncbi:hypothetical protein Pcinc_032512 [Petrolisthes cinctipes]|uniref:Uncharacterized protein n=1 Tax=Petrolisthes cinctipes TaxID=88211 RepID=A0AAE1BUQ2_PETCI|nr:hypothetical protein Pcinc_036887 [Petrolisthes cinctipes]KAK3861537.1 hypothetical protein Pcinc_032512 [Petrolisthes cinctipes]
MHQVIHSNGTISRRVLYVSTFLQRHFNDLSSEIKPFKQPSCPGGCTREGQVNLSNRSVLLVSGVLGRAGQDILPGRHAGTLHQGGRHYTTVTSHSRGLRHNHAWHGGVRGTPPPHNSANTSSSRHEPPLRAVPGTLTPALTDGLPTTAVP